MFASGEYDIYILREVSLYILGYPWLLILLPQHPQCWDYRHSPPCPATETIINSFLVLFWWCGQRLSLWQARVWFKPSLGEGSPFAESMICVPRSGSEQGTEEHWPFCVVRKHIISGCWRGTMTLSTLWFSSLWTYCMAGVYFAWSIASSVHLAWRVGNMVFLSTRRMKYPWVLVPCSERVG